MGNTIAMVRSQYVVWVNSRERSEKVRPCKGVIKELKVPDLSNTSNVGQ